MSRTLREDSDVVLAAVNGHTLKAEFMGVLFSSLDFVPTELVAGWCRYQRTEIPRLHPVSFSNLLVILLTP